MTTQYTPILQLALPVTGELNGTWGDVVNDNITSMVEQAIAGMATISTWTTNAHTLTTANGTTDEARCAMLLLQTGSGGTALSGAGQVICPALTKLYVVKNDAAYAVTVKTSGGSGVSVSAGDTTFVFCDGTNVVACVTQITNGHITGNLTVDGNTTLGDASGDTVTINSGTTTLKAQAALRFEDAAGGEYVGLKAPVSVTTYTLTLPIADGNSGDALVTNGAGVLSWSTAASGDVYGPASATDTAVALFDGTTGKLIKNSTVTVASDGATVIAANSTSDGLRITQTGTGNALVIEDSASPDSTPFTIDTNGIVITGNGGAVPVAGYYPQVQSHMVSNNTGFAATSWQNGSGNGGVWFAKSRGGVSGTHTVVQSGDSLGNIRAYGSDGTGFIQAAQISAEVDGTPGANDMPGRLVFSTTADGSGSLTERMRIDNNGNVGLGTTGSALSRFNVAGTFTQSSGNSQAIRVTGTVPSTATSTYYGVTHTLATTAAAFTLSSAGHFTADQGTIGAGSAVTNQYGYIAGNSLTGATNNYGFYSNIAAGTGRYNFYAAGTADNYFAGNVGVGAVPGTNKFAAYANSNRGFFIDSLGAGTFQYNDNGSPQLNLKNLGVSGVDQSFIIAAYLGSDGSTSRTAGGIKFGASSDYTTAANADSYMALYTSLDGSNVEVMRLRSDGNVGIGGAGAAGAVVRVDKALTGGASPFGIGVISQTNSDATSDASYFRTSASTQAASFTLTKLRHFFASQSTIGAGSTVTGQYGYEAESTLTGATNNYGFYSAIASGTGRWNFYAAGTADNYFAGRVGVNTTGTSSGYVTIAAGSNQLTITTADPTTYGRVDVGHFTNGAFIGTFAGTNTASDLLRFGTTGTERMRIDSSGNVLVTGAGGLGYGTGSGGAVTQTTSRTTGVTINKTNGSITLVSAAGSATYQSFTVTNSTVAATDTIIVNQKSGTDLYEVFITAVAAGSFRITFATTGGTTTEQPVFNFAVIKAVTA